MPNYSTDDLVRSYREERQQLIASGQDRLNVWDVVRARFPGVTDQQLGTALLQVMTEDFKNAGL